MDLPGWSDGRALLARVIGPALVLWGGLVGIGFALAGPLSGPLRDEVDVDQYLAADRSHSWNTITLLWSDLGSTEVVIGASLIIGALILWRTRDWRLAAVPAIAILIETAIFLSIASLVNRERPPVVKLDVAPPTSNYPSGHVGASTALYLAFAFLALHRAGVAAADHSVSLPSHPAPGHLRPPIPGNALRHRRRCRPCRSPRYEGKPGLSENGGSDLVSDHFVGMRPSKVTAKALRAGFHLVAHRALPLPVGSRDRVVR